MTKTSGKEKCYFPADLNWYLISKEDLKLSDSSKDDSIPTDLKALLAKSKEIYDSQCEAFQSSRSVSGANQEWFKSVVSKGTLRDKISALTIAIQECGIYCLSFVEQLFTMTKHANSRESLFAIEGLREVFYDQLLPSDRKLRYFDQSLQLLAASPSKRALVVWYFEDSIKKIYLQYLQVLEGQLKDPAAFHRCKILSIVWELFVAKPEQEQSNLALILNKLGDKDNKVSSKATYLLLLTSQKHSNMLPVLVRETRMVIGNPTASLRSIYYGLIFLNQIMLTPDSVAVSNLLIETYFEVFQRLLTMKQSQETSKSISAILTGINRAFPFGQLKEDKLKGYLDQLFQLVHGDNFNTSMQSLNLLFTISQSDSSIQDRFYRTLYELLDDPIKLGTSSKQPFLINLLFKAIKVDENVDRIGSFFKKLLQSANFQQPAYICATLVLLSELIKRKEFFLKKFSQKSLFAPPTKSDVGLGEQYDFKKRDPRFTNANKSPLWWDLEIFSKHYHPTVVKFTTALLNHKFIECSVDPFERFTCSEFLDKFAYKNPKRQVIDETGRPVPKQRGISAMQPVKLRSEQEKTEVPVNLKYSVNEKNSHGAAMVVVPEDEQFFAQFFTSEMMQQISAKRNERKKKKTDEEEEGVLNEEQLDEDFDQYLATNEGIIDDEEDELDDEQDEFDDEQDELDEEFNQQDDDLNDDMQTEVVESDQQDPSTDHSNSKKKKKQAFPLYAEAQDYLSD